MNIIRISTLLTVSLLLSLPLYGKVIHVSKSGTPNGTGESWANAIDEFVQAIGIAQDGDTIFIAGGTYLLPLMDRLWITQSLHIYGGFAGWETSIEDRVPDTNLTSISGDSLYSKIVVQNPKGFFSIDRIQFVNGKSYYPYAEPLPDSLFYVPFGGIIQFLGPHNGEALALSITNCVFKDNYAYSGGAAAIISGKAGFSIKLKNCLFETNYARYDGYSGVLYISASKLPTCRIEIDSCRFINNFSGAFGYSCIYIHIDSEYDTDTVIISNCVFEKNISSYNTYGTIGIYRPWLSKNQPFVVLKNCHFASNHSYTLNSGGTRFGGLALNSENIHQVLVHNCSFIGNHSGGYGLLNGYSFDVQNSLFANNYSKDGGTVYFDHSSNIRPPRHLTRFTNCTFANNHSKGPGALFLKNGPFSHFEMNNCVLYNNSSTYHPSMFYSRTADTSDVISPQIGYLGGDVDPSLFHFNQESDSWILDTDVLTWFSGDPMFVDSMTNDFRLKRCSPYINKGSNAFEAGDFDLQGNSRILEDTVDLGAYERLSFNPEGELLAATCAHDANGEILLWPGTYTPPVQWDIADNVGTPRINGELSPGAYEARMRDGEDCGAEFNIVIPGPDTIIAWIGVKGAKQASPTGFIRIDSLSGGVPEYEIKWSDGSDGLSTSGLFPGKHTVTITDEVGCARVWEIEVPFNNHMPLPNAMGHLTVLNPARNYLEYRWDPADPLLSYAYLIVNGLGQEVASGLLGPGRQRIQLSVLPSGYYWLIVSHLDQRATYPIILVNH